LRIWTMGWSFDLIRALILEFSDSHDTSVPLKKNQSTKTNELAIAKQQITNSFICLFAWRGRRSLHVYVLDLGLRKWRSSALIKSL
jgi:DUF2075 family protein